MRSNQRKNSLAALLIIVASLLIVLPVQTVKAQTATIVVSPSSNMVSVGQTFTVHIQISNVQNLYGVDIELTWDTSMLKLESNQSFVGVSSGILNTPILSVQDTASQQTGEYNLIATSENPAGPWSGSATVATFTFKVTSAGQSNLTLSSSESKLPELASYVAPGSGTSEDIPVTVTNGAVTTSSTSTSPTASASPTSTATTSHPTNSPSASPTPTPKVPEFPASMILLLLVLVPLVLLLTRLSKRGFKESIRR